MFSGQVIENIFLFGFRRGVKGVLLVQRLNFSLHTVYVALNASVRHLININFNTFLSMSYRIAFKYVMEGKLYRKLIQKIIINRV